MQFKALASLFSLVAVVTAFPADVKVKRDLKIIHPGSNDINRTQEHLDHLTYTAPPGTLISQQKKDIYYSSGYAALTVVVDTYLMDLTWNEDFRETNASPNPGKKTVMITEGTTITTGDENTVTMGLSAAFEGIGLSFGVENKKFSSTERSKSQSISTEIPLSANSTSIYYQRYYHFRSHVWFLSDQKNQYSVVYKNGAIYDAYFNTEVMSADHALLLEPLTGSAALTDVKTATPAPRYDLPKLTSRRDYGNLVNPAKSALQNYLKSL